MNSCHRIGALLVLAMGTACAQTPEASNPQVARCAATATQALTESGRDGRKVGIIAADRANASIDRWEASFSKANPRQVATLITVPVMANFADDAAPPRVLLEARCGFTNDQLLAFELVPRAIPLRP
jgi:hypothetical protein